jgi:phospholipase C
MTKTSFTSRVLRGGSFDAIAGTLGQMFDFSAPPNVTPFLLDERTSQPQRSP